MKESHSNASFHSQKGKNKKKTMTLKSLQSNTNTHRKNQTNSSLLRIDTNLPYTPSLNNPNQTITPTQVQTQSLFNRTNTNTNTYSHPMKAEDEMFFLSERQRTSLNNDPVTLTASSALSPTNQDSNSKSNIRVFVRFRPMNDVENDLIKNGVGSECVEYLSNTDVKIKSGSTGHPFTFDHVFTSQALQKDIYNLIGRDIVKDIVAGYNGTIFAYGQSGSGKTHTMYGDNNYDETAMGIIPRIISEIFAYVDQCDDNVTFQFKMSFMQIYREIIYDLLTGEKDLKIKENPIRGIYVDKLTEVYIATLEDFMEYVEFAQENRIVSETKLNSCSSRSHSIMIFEVTQTLVNENITKKGILNLVDLAGSEKISKTGAVGETLEEAKKINLSLSALGNVIHSLTSNAEHIPYRNSKLTRILQESLGGNYKTNIIVACSPHSYHLEETTSSLLFAQRAKKIKNKVKLNIKLSYEELQKIVEKLKLALQKEKDENARLRGINNNGKITIQGGEKTEDTTIPLTKVIMNSDELSISHSHLDMNDESSFKEGHLPNCEEHMKIIKKLKETIDRLTNELKEKDEIISTLEQSNMNKDKLLGDHPKLKLLSNNDLDIMEDSSIQLEQRDIVNGGLLNPEILPIQSPPPKALLEEMHEKIASLIDNNQVLQSNTLNMSSLNDNCMSMLGSLQKMCEDSFKNNFSNSTDGHINLLNQTSALLSKTIHSNTFDQIALENKDSIKTVFDDIFKEVIQGKDQKHLKPLASMFLFSYLDAYFNLQIVNKLNQDLTSQNENLKKMNSALFDIVKEALESHMETNQKINRQSFLFSDNQGNVNVGSLRRGAGSSIALNAFMGNGGRTGGMTPNNNPMMNIGSFFENQQCNVINEVMEMDNEDKSPKTTRVKQPRNLYQRTTGRISTLVNRKGLQLINKLQVNRENMMNGTEGGGNEGDGGMMKGQTGGDVVMRHIPMSKVSKLNFNLGEIATVNAIYEKELEMKMNKINVLKDFVVCSLKETEKYNQRLADLKNHYGNIFQETKEVVFEKFINKEASDTNIDDIPKVKTEQKPMNIPQEETDQNLQLKTEEKPMNKPIEKIKTSLTAKPKMKTKKKVKPNPLQEPSIITTNTNQPIHHLSNSQLNLPSNTTPNKLYQNDVNPINNPYFNYDDINLNDIKDSSFDSSINNQKLEISNDLSQSKTKSKIKARANTKSKPKGQSLYKTTMKNNSISNQDRFEIQVPIKKHQSVDQMMIPQLMLNTEQKDIEMLITEYVEAGSATRRFDGIEVKCDKNQKLICSYTSGLNASRQIQFTPIKCPLKPAFGDINKSVYPESESFKE